MNGPANLDDSSGRFLETRRFSGDEIAKVFSVNAADASFLETRRFLDEEVAKVFALPAGALESGSAGNSALDSDGPLIALNSSDSRNE